MSKKTKPATASAGGTAATRVTRAPLVRRALTQPSASPFKLVDWLVRSVQIPERDGSVAFACDDVEAPPSWSNLAVA